MVMDHDPGGTIHSDGSRLINVDATPIEHQFIHSLRTI
jgi:hypothetical protein